MKILKQIALITGFCLAGECISFGLSKLIPGFFFPGSLIGMIILFILLYLKVIHFEWIAEVGTFFVDNMGFFFVPAAVSVMSYFDVIRPNLWKMLLLCMICFFTTFIAIALSVHLTLLIQEKIHEEKGHGHE